MILHTKCLSCFLVVFYDHIAISVSCLYAIPQNSHHKGLPKIINGMLISSASFCTTNSKQTSLESPCSEKSTSNFLSYGIALSLLLRHGNINIQLLIYGLNLSWWQYTVKSSVATSYVMTWLIACKDFIVYSCYIAKSKVFWLPKFSYIDVSLNICSFMDSIIWLISSW